MSDPRALVRLIDEAVWRLRRAQFDISTGQAIDLARAVKAVGLGDRVAVRRAMAAVVVSRVEDQRRFEAVFDEFFAATARPSGGLLERLRQHGFQASELDVLRDLLFALGADGHGGLSALLLDPAELDRALVLSGSAQRIDAESSQRSGFETHRLLRETGLDRSRDALASLRVRLSEALGVRGAALADAVAADLDRLREEVRSYVLATHAARVRELAERTAGSNVATKPFAVLSDAEVEAVRRALRRLADRLKGRARVRARRASRGRVDVRRTLRASLGTGGVPFALKRKVRCDDRPRMIVLCDISDSVRTVAGLLLEFTYAVHEVFEDVRTFVFVSELGETTDLFTRERANVAVERAWHGAGLVRTDENSNYGRVLRTFEARHLDDLDRDTTVVVLGDGRSNYHDSASEVLDRVRARTRALLWLCPEPRSAWGRGDSAMRAYASKCTAVYQVQCAADLEGVGRALAV